MSVCLLITCLATLALYVMLIYLSSSITDTRGLIGQRQLPTLETVGLGHLRLINLFLTWHKFKCFVRSLLFYVA